MGVPIVFPTFCHVSEFGRRGYERLDTMISMSLPLTLWAPSLKLASHYSTGQIDADSLVRLVDRGAVRIAGREDWIKNGIKRRDRAKEWEGADWTEQDSRIERIAAADEGIRQETARRVQIVADEDGYDRADAFLQVRPDAIPKISRMIQNGKIPDGSRERIERNQLTGYKAAREVLRDARNHGRAIADTASKVPFLSLEYGNFIDLVNECDDPIVYESERRLRSTKEFAKKTLNLLDDLGAFGQPNLEKFAGSAAHHELANWIGEMAEIVQDRNVGDIEGLILESLRKDIDENFPQFSISGAPAAYEAFKNELPFETFGILYELLACAANPRDPWHLGSATLVVIRYGYRLLSSFGFVPMGYSGMNWPFFYVFGRKPRINDLEKFQHYLKVRQQNLRRTTTDN